MDFLWDEKELNEIPHMWHQGLSVWDIGKSFNRDPDEVAIAIIHLSKKGKIRQRWGGLNGRRKVKP